MSAERLLLLATLAAMTTLAVCRPNQFRKLDLAAVVNRTVCPIRVEIDENPDRVPRRIKVMKCAEEPNQWCRAQRIPAHECCQHNHDNHLMECVEISDTVVVYDKRRKTTSTMDVAVGCTCMINQSTNAPPLPHGPT